jgi:hypothetical protein
LAGRRKAGGDQPWSRANPLSHHFAYRGDERREGVLKFVEMLCGMADNETLPVFPRGKTTLNSGTLGIDGQY